jgi:two-component system, NtrC family, C4-dicarboxylate transport response regulator DctD
MAQLILVVDDDDDVRSLVVLQLEISGYEVVESASVAGGLALIQERSPHLVLTDLNFGTDSGERLVAVCQATGQPVILMTASVETRDLPESLRRDVPLLRKPFTLDDLVELVTAQARP